MHPAELLGPVGHLRELCDRETGGVGGEDGLVGCVLDNLLVDVLLYRHLLGDGLNDDVGVADGLLDVDQRRDPVQRRVGLVLCELVFLRKLVQRPLDVVVPVLDELVFDVPHPNLVAGEGGHLGDAVTHVPRAEYRDSVDVLEIHDVRHHSRPTFQRFSRTKTSLEFIPFAK